MIYVNLKKVDPQHFPDNTQMLLDFSINIVNGSEKDIDIYWTYENDEECMRLWYIVNHIREYIPDAKIILTMPFVANGRMDRTKSEKEVFTLKYFCRFINTLNFYTVRILDPHSNVSTALLDRVEVLNVENYISSAIETAFRNVEDENCIIFFPDSGAMKRYGSMKCFKGFSLIYGEKDRVWETGEIRGLKVFNQNGDRIDNINCLIGRTVLMIDDIISYGGTLYHSAKKLKEMGASNIFAYATHVENSILDEEKGTFVKLLNDGTVCALYTTDSIYKGEHQRIKKII